MLLSASSPPNFNGLKNFPIYLLLLFLTTFVACQNQTEPSEDAVVPIEDSAAINPPTFTEQQVPGKPVILVVRTNTAKAHQQPDFEAPIVGHYQKEDSLVFTNRVTQELSTQLVEGLPYQEPWLRIILPNQEMAWVYGAHVDFEAAAQPALADLVLYPRVAALFGEELAQQMGLYQKEIPLTGSLPAFRSLYSRAQLIKDSLEQQLTNLQLAHPNLSPNFFWLNGLLQGLTLHYIPEQNQYYLFRDLKQWLSISQQTPALADDAFLEVLLASYPADSMAYYYYGWQLPLEDKGWCSLLGTGIHEQVLEKLDSAWDSSSYFLPELQTIQQAVLEDIATSNQYWMPLPAVQKELDSILQREYPFFTRGDWVALKTKRAFLTAPQEHDLVLNLFEGEE